MTPATISSPEEIEALKTADKAARLEAAREAVIEAAMNWWELLPDIKTACRRLEDACDELDCVRRSK